jgi:hypothetical protein
LDAHTSPLAGYTLNTGTTYGIHNDNFDVSKLNLVYRSYPESTFWYPTDDKSDCTVGLLVPNVEIIPSGPLSYGSFEFGERCKLLTQDYGWWGWLGRGLADILFVAAVESRTLPRPRSRTVLADHEILFVKMGGIGENTNFQGYWGEFTKKGGYRGK